MADRALKDPLGREITLHDHTWFGHIVKGHPEVAGDRAKIEKAISSPQQIQKSTSAAECRLYYGGASKTGRRIVVVADVVGGYVKTAYATKKLKKGAIEWKA